MCIIGIDLGGSFVKSALINEDGTLLYEVKIPSFANISRESVISQLIKSINKIRDFAIRYNYHINGIGIGTPGIVDETNRIVLGGAENIKGWEKLALAEIIESKTGLPTRLGNDANLMALGETLYGAGKGYSDMIFLTVGTGIGGAAVIAGRLFRGFANRGMELGHVPFIANGKSCSCGSKGCFEAYAFTQALINRFIQRKEETGTIYLKQEINGEYIVRLYEEGDAIALACFDEHCDYLGHGIAGFINIFSPQRVIIGGGLCEAGEFYIQKVREKAFRYSISECAANTEVVRAVLGNKAGCIGAASLFLKVE